MITIDKLTVKFGGVVALDDLSLTLKEDVVGLIGPNGAGKTTLTNAMSGFVAIAGGGIHVDGVDLMTLPPNQRARWGLGRSFQKVQIVDDLTVTEHLLTVMDATGVKRADRPSKINHILDFTGISDQAKTRGADLNVFQRRMTEIAKCLAGDPKILLLDEPGGGLSESEMQHLRVVITEAKDRFGTQIILVDHDVDLIRDVCETTAVLDFGKLIAFGPTAEVLQDEIVKTAYLGR
ncbi:ATP-binding cassette domain-containing protein [Yoonia sp. SS1-5]|uniref:ABC transporter ATP-binding protein n=1 Tax=Yoonia rhodophyticola TaxID=3137370 RepID=A0AAN0MIE1_9RHOB